MKLKTAILYGLPAVIIALVLAFPLIFKKSGGGSGDSNQVTEVKWKELRKLDFKTGDMPGELREKLHSKIKLPGFAVPLGSDFKEVKEFILVPNQGMCIHVPPPPPNLMIFVELKQPKSLKELQGPIWVEGMMKLETVKNNYGSAAWKLRAQDIKAYLR